jgi:cytoskeletal protein RodZ
MKPEPNRATSSALSADSGLGNTLKRLRESKSLSVAAVSARLKFSVRQIEALEAENWAELPGGLSLRGMVNNYGRLLETDTDLLASMLGASTPKARPTHKSIAAGPATQSVGPMHEEQSSRSGWGWLLIILVLVCAAVYYALDRGWLPESWQFTNWFKGSSNP